MMRRRIGFVVSRYGEQVLGGAEKATRILAEHITLADLAEVEILTTCAYNHFSWQNDLPPGKSFLNNVPIRRFPVEHARRNAARYDELHGRIIQQQKLSPDEEYEWVNQSAHSPGLYDYIEKHGTTFDFLIFGPYLFGTTYYGSAIYPDRSILWPHLHNETYAYLKPTRDMYHTCLGVMFNTFPEARLARRLYGPHPGAQVTGEIVEAGSASIHADGEKFRARYNLRAPFILYAGRLESGKNVPLLLQFFLEYKRRHQGSLKLVFMGAGPEVLPEREDIINLGFVKEHDKWDVYAAATLLCQPSVNESFSIVVMESWLCGVPVLVNADCSVTRYHVSHSNGGLYFGEYDDFEAALDLLLTDEHLRQRMGLNGRQYLQNHYAPQSVLQCLEMAFKKWAQLRSTQ